MDSKHYFNIITGRCEPELPADSVPDYAFSRLNRAGLLYRPVIDNHYLAAGNTKPVWPEGKSFAVCLSHDVDAISDINIRQNARAVLQVLRFSKELSLGDTAKKLLMHGLRTLKGSFNRSENICRFDDWLAVEKSVGARSTFFFPPEHVRTKHYSDCIYTYNQKIIFQDQSTEVSSLITYLNQNGWEIGLHPSWHTATSLDEMKYQKKQLDNVLGHESLSVRQHFLRYDPVYSPRVQQDAGFKYDSSVGFNDNVGFRRATSYPFYSHDLLNNQMLDIMEIPLVAQDGAMMLPNKGMRINSTEAMKYLKLLINEVKKVSGVLTLSWHPHTIHWPGVFEVYKNVLEELAKENVWFATSSEIGTWWKSQKLPDINGFSASLAKKMNS